MALQNTGRKIWNTLIEINADTNVPTGNTKANTISDPDYVAPVNDFVLCPPPVPPVGQVFNRVNIQWKNQTTEFIYFQSVSILPQNISDVEYYNGNYGSYPGQIITTPYVKQPDTNFKLSMTAIEFSKNIPVLVTVRYISPTVDDIVISFVIVPGDTKSFENILSTLSVPPTDNLIEITITENP